LPLKLHFKERNTHCQCARERRRRKEERKKKLKKINLRTKTSWQLGRGEKKGKITLGMMKYSGDKAVSNKSVRE
jgi:hypothetical protein